MNNGIVKKLIISFLGVALVSLLTVNLLMNLSVTFSFASYLDNQLKTETEDIKNQLISAYTPDAKWSTEELMNISHFAMVRNLNVRIYDVQNRLFWDSTKMMPEYAHDSNEDIQTSGKKISSPLIKDGQSIGNLEIEMGSMYHEHEQQFLNSFNNFLWISLVIVLIGVYFFSRYIAKGISSPLVRIKEAAIRMREGDLTQRVTGTEQSDEVSEVGKALNRLAESLQQQEQLRKHLTADIAHELRTPLATVRSHLEAFQDGIWQPTEDKIQICHEQVMQLVHLVKDLEGLADIENPMLKLDKQQVELRQLLQDVIFAAEGQWLDKRVTLEMDLEQSLFVKGDSKRLHQVFTNLIQNAYKYNRENGFIRIQGHEAGDFAVICISDTGIGISPEEQFYIFERFYRGEKSRNRKTGGAGIGLAVVKAIVEAHGGTVSVESEADTGSEFTVRLPK